MPADREIMETDLRILAEFAAQGIHADGGARALAPGDAVKACRRLFDATDLSAAAGRLPQGAGSKPDEKLLAVIRGGAVRMLDAFLATVPPHGTEESLLNLLAEGAVRFSQGEYAWPAAQLGHPLPDQAGLPLPPAFTSVNLPDSRVAVMRSDWAPRAHYLAVNYGERPQFSLAAFGETMAVGCGLAESAERSGAAAWTTGLFLDGLAHGRSILFVKPVGDLPGYWLVTETATGGEPGQQVLWYLHSPLPLAGNGGLVTATAGPGRPGLQVIPARPMDLRLGRGSAPSGEPESNWLAFAGPTQAGGGFDLAVLLAPYERIAPAPGSFQIEPFAGTAGPGQRAYRIMHHRGYDLLVVSDGQPAQFDELELATDARFLLIRVRGGAVAARQASRCSQIRFRGEELSL